MQIATPGNKEKLLLGRQTSYSNWMLAGSIASGGGVTVPTDDPIYNTPHPNVLISNTPIDGEVALLLAKVEMRAVSDTNPNGLERITFWVNPDLSQALKDTDAVGGTSYDSASDFGSLGRIRVGGGGTGATGTKHSIDEIHISEYPPSPHVRISVEQPSSVELENGVATTIFGNHPVGQSETRTYTVRNIGRIASTNLSIAIGGDDAANFVASALSSNSLAPGESTTFSVTYTGTELGKTSNAQLTILSDDQANGTFQVALKGTATVKGSQSITVPTPGNRFISELYTLGGTGGASGEPLTYTVLSGPAVIEGGKLRFTGGGIVTLAIDQAGNANYDPASRVQTSFNVLLPKPDVAVGKTASALVGVNKYAPTKQLVTIPTTLARPVTGHIGVANRVTLSGKRAATPISVRGTKGNALFAVKYLGPGGNLTAKVVAGKYQTPAIDSASAIVRLRSVVTPNKSKLTKKKGKKITYLKKTFASTIQVKSVVYPRATDTAKLNVQTK